MNNCEFYDVIFELSNEERVIIMKFFNYRKTALAV
jgi:hypothetical protein